MKEPQPDNHETPSLDPAALAAREISESRIPLYEEIIRLRKALIDIQILCNDSGDLDFEEIAGDIQEIAVEALGAPQ